MNDIALLASYRKWPVCRFCGAQKGPTGLCQVQYLSRNTLKSVRELVVVHTHHCTFLGMHA